jgi:hypothetical protein
METSTVPISCDIGTSDPAVPLALIILLDGVEIYRNNLVNREVKFKYELNGDAAKHELQFVMLGKTPEHTRLDAQGNITQDAVLSISNVRFDDIAIQQIVTNLAVYTHDFNGTQAQTQDRFYGWLGCNGTVSLKFTTPVYLWLLENM